MTVLDSFLTKGFSHKICEDYIIHGKTPTDIPFVILGDGCSSSPNTDIGARVLVSAARDFISSELSEEPINTDWMGTCVINQSKVIAQLLGYGNNILDSTLIIAYIIDKKVHIHMYGDGCIIAIDQRGLVETLTVDYPTNMPYYLSYQLNRDYQNKYMELNTIKNTLHEVHLTSSIAFQRKQYSRTMVAEIISTNKDPLIHSYFSLNFSDYPTILIASDGVSSFPEGESNNAMSQIAGFKSYKTNFINRRLKKVLKKLEKQGIKHYDDISIGGFHRERL